MGLRPGRRTSSSRSCPRHEQPLVIDHDLRERGRERARFGMTLEHWIFSLHLLMAATLVGSLVMSWIVVVSLLSAHTPGATLNLSRVGMVGTVTTVVGLVGAIAFGIWLALLRDAFPVWDGGGIAAIVLRCVAAGAVPPGGGPAQQRGGGVVALVRRVREAGREGTCAHCRRRHRPERRADRL